jgi:hypothetical protein
MYSKLRCLVAYLLLVFLPIQAMASVVEWSCGDNMSHCHGMKASALDCCAHQKRSFDAHRHHSDGTSRDTGHQHTSCGIGTTCLGAAAMAALPSAKMVLPQFGSELPNVFVFSSYTSFISEGLQRPPSISSQHRQA